MKRQIDILDIVFTTFLISVTLFVTSLLTAMAYAGYRFYLELNPPTSSDVSGQTCCYVCGTGEDE